MLIDEYLLTLPARGRSGARLSVRTGGEHWHSFYDWAVTQEGVLRWHTDANLKVFSDRFGFFYVRFYREAAACVLPAEIEKIFGSAPASGFAGMLQEALHTVASSAGFDIPHGLEIGEAWDMLDGLRTREALPAETIAAWANRYRMQSKSGFLKGVKW